MFIYIYIYMLQCVDKCSKLLPSTRRHSLARFSRRTELGGGVPYHVGITTDGARVCVCVCVLAYICFVRLEEDLLRLLTVNFPVR